MFENKQRVLENYLPHFFESQLTFLALKSRILSHLKLNVPMNMLGELLRGFI